MQSTFVGVPDEHVIALAKLRLERAKVKLHCCTRAQAIGILRSVQPAPSKNLPLTIKAAQPQDVCRNCGKPIPFGTPCKICFNGEIPEHISCKRVSKLKRQEEAALRRLYLAAIQQVEIR